MNQFTLSIKSLFLSIFLIVLNSHAFGQNAQHNIKLEPLSLADSRFGITFEEKIHNRLSIEATLGYFTAYSRTASPGISRDTVSILEQVFIEPIGCALLGASLISLGGTPDNGLCHQQGQITEQINQKGYYFKVGTRYYPFLKNSLQKGFFIQSNLEHHSYEYDEIITTGTSVNLPSGGREDTKTLEINEQLKGRSTGLSLYIGHKWILKKRITIEPILSGIWIIQPSERQVFNHQIGNPTGLTEKANNMYFDGFLVRIGYQFYGK